MQSSREENLEYERDNYLKYTLRKLYKLKFIIKRMKIEK